MLPESLQQVGPTDRSPGKRFHYSDLKIEAAIFLLIALTFAAVLGKDSITSKQLIFTPTSSQYLAYTYGDQANGGQSSITPDPAQKLSWSCTLRTGFQYPYCAYGLQLDASNTDKGLDFSRYQDVRLKLNYKGPNAHMKLLLKGSVPAALRDQIHDSSIPISTQFDVVNGENDIHLTKAQLVPEPWWLGSHNLGPDAAGIPLENIVAVAIGSGDAMPLGRFDVSVKSLAFTGSFLSTEQWYLVILGVWLVLTGAFLVYRFLGLEKGYQARQRHQAEESQALAVAHAAAEAASAAKSQFLANMSHELRTPLNAILGYAQLLKSADLTEPQLSGVKTIQHSGEHLLALITDVLDIAKVEAGKLDLLPARFDMRACIFNAAQMIRLRAEEKGLRFTVEVGDDVPQNVIADQKRIRQILINLLGNAVKFTHTGEVRLEVSVVSRTDGEARLRFAFIDSGIGISEDQIERIFRPFEQSGNAIDRSGGTGLGLSITHKIVQMMQGEVSVDSTIGHGSRFTVEAPFQLVGQLATPETTMPLLSIEAAESHEAPEPMIAPDDETMERLLSLARSGNLRAIRKEIPAILAMGPQYKPFAEQLDALAAAYQSPAVLRLIETYAQKRTAA